MYSIGELAKLSNTTVRTLRYYDEIGLLKPSNVSEGGHRYYNNEDVEVLHNIVTLKELGFELETIKSILTNQSKSSRELLEMRLEMIHKEQEQLRKKEKKIKSILQLNDLEGRYDWSTIFETFSKYKYSYHEIDKHLREIFTEEEMEIVRQFPKFGEDNELSFEFIELTKKARTLMGQSPYTEEAQILAAKCVQLGKKIYKGNWNLHHKIREMDSEEMEKIGIYQFEPSVLQFSEEIINIYINKNIGEFSNEENNSV